LRSLRPLRLCVELFSVSLWLCGEKATLIFFFGLELFIKKSYSLT
jgi:hypothetical protein